MKNGEKDRMVRSELQPEKCGGNQWPIVSNRHQGGRIHPLPVAALVGYAIAEVKHGLAVFKLNPRECHYNPFSTIHGGILST